MSASVRIDGLQTEQRNPRSTSIDIVSTLELCEIINNEDALIAAAVRDCLPLIANAIDALSQRVSAGGRVIYVGAGTSGRLGVLDASEVPPTYSASEGVFIGVIAGGDRALRSAIEGAEDSRHGAIQDLEALALDGTIDSVVGIASSGRTPYVLGCLEFAKVKGCATVGIACTSPSAIGQHTDVDFRIEAVTGPEVVTGSTRMKAGTATKLILNMISSGIMIRLGKTFGNIMIDVKPTNGKLKHRARHIIREIAGRNCSFTDTQLDNLIVECDGSVKLASVILCLGVSKSEAKARLDAANGRLAIVLRSVPFALGSATRIELSGIVVCVDAGGSHCRATVLHSSGDHATGIAGPCNVAEVGVDAAIIEIRLAIERALQKFFESRIESLASYRVLSAWVAIAGADRRGCAPQLKAALQQLMPSAAQIRVSNDLELLATVAGLKPAVDNVVVLVAGTGSIAISYNREGSGFVQRARAGGWGPLLGDDGSGFDIGRRAIRAVLRQIESEEALQKTRDTPLIDAMHGAIVNYYQPAGTERDSYDLLSAILLGDSETSKTPGSAKQRIADCAALVVGMSKSSAQSAAITAAARHDLAELLQSVITSGHVNISEGVLVLAGGVFQSSEFRDDFVNALLSRNLNFMKTRQISQPTLEGAQHLISTWMLTK